MCPLFAHPELDLLPEAGGASDDEVRTQVWSLLTTLYPRGQWSERRRDQRYPFPYLVHLTPVDADGITPAGEPVVAVGKHLSEQGLGFYHPKPLPYRRMIVSLETGSGSQVAFLIDLTWCRFTRQKWYESGGRFVQAVDPPTDVHT
jgi:hypothetical protein